MNMEEIRHVEALQRRIKQLEAALQALHAQIQVSSDQRIWDPVSLLKTIRIALEDKEPAK